MRSISSFLWVALLVLSLLPFMAKANSFDGVATDYLSLRLGDTEHEVATKLEHLTEQGIIRMSDQPNTFSHELIGDLVNVSLSFDDSKLDRILIKAPASYPISHCDSPWVVDIQRYLGAMEKQYGLPTKDFDYPSISDPEAIMGSLTLAGKWLLRDKKVLVGVDELGGELIPLIIISAD